MTIRGVDDSASLTLGECGFTRGRRLSLVGRVDGQMAERMSGRSGAPSGFDIVRDHSNLKFSG